jgi:serine/threonine-protein kinase RsbW
MNREPPSSPAMSGAALSSLRLVATRDVPASAEVAERARAFLDGLGCTDRAATQVALVVEEMVSNVAKYAWPDDTPRAFSLEVDARREGGELVVTLTTDDDGTPFDPTQAAPPDLEADLDARPIGGLGIHMIRTMTDRQSYQRIGGRNRFNVVKRCEASP